MQQDLWVSGFSFGPSGLIDAAEWTRQRLVQLGVPYPAGNRLQRARILIEELNSQSLGFRPEDDELLDRVTEGQWTILEQYIVVRSLGRPGRILPTAYRQKLEEMLSGTDSADNDQNPLARNTQFELYVAALLIMGDVPVWIGEPDLRFKYFGRECGIAAKRVRSFRQVPRRADDAVEQLTASGVPGFVAVNVDVLLKRTRDLPEPEVTLAERLEVVQAMESRLAGKDHVVGSMAFGRDCVWDFTGERPTADVRAYFRFIFYARAANDQEDGERFFCQLMERMNSRLPKL